MTEDEPIESREFPGIFVRVRGRLSRTGEVQWDPCLRTDKGTSEIKVPTDSAKGMISENDTAVVVSKDQFAIDFLDYQGKVLVCNITKPRYFSEDQEWATFVARLPYHKQTQAVRLRLGNRELGVLNVPTDRPCFNLLSPGKDSCIECLGILHLRWTSHCSLYPLTFYVRYSHNGMDWVRPGVNLKTNDYYLDLREMPGGKQCVAQVIATNGYQTSYVQTRHFEVPIKPPEILLGNTSGPVLFAQGFSREHGPIIGENIEWLIDDDVVVQYGGTLDIRNLATGIDLKSGGKLVPGIHRVSVMVHDPKGEQRVELVGTYDSRTGLSVSPNPL